MDLKKYIKNSVGLLLFAFCVVSCSPQPLEIQDLDIIIIEPGNKDFYKYSDASDSGMGWVETANGNKYSYHFNCGKVFITSNRPMKAAYYLKMRGKIQTEIVENQFSYPVKGLTAFRIYY